MTTTATGGGGVGGGGGGDDGDEKGRCETGERAETDDDDDDDGARVVVVVVVDGGGGGGVVGAWDDAGGGDGAVRGVGGGFDAPVRRAGDRCVAVRARDVSFEDPLTKYDSFAGYAFNIQMLRRVFSPEYVMHDIRKSGPWEITTRWTMTMAVPAFPFAWRPRLTFTGTSIMGVDPESKRVRTHVDTWDSIENQRHLSPEGVAEVLKQIFDFTQTPELDTPGYVVLKKQRDYEVRRYEPYLVASTGPGVNVEEMKTSAPTKMDGEVAGQAFNSLAGYIFGQANATGTKMEMTTPVFTKENTMQFVVSGESMDALPASTNEKVVLQEEKGGIFVAKKFLVRGDGRIGARSGGRATQVRGARRFGDERKRGVGAVQRSVHQPARA